MNLINQSFFSILISSATSTLLLIAWRLLRGLFMAVNPKMVYTTLRWICVLYTLPVGYIAMILTYRVWFQGKEQAWQNVFVTTRLITGGLGIYGVLWFIAACVLFSYRWADHKDWCRKLEDNIPIDDPMIIRTFARVCRNLGIPEGKLPLNKNVLVRSPLVLGSLHPQVLLPEHDYTEEDLELIFYHELSHYRHRDLIFKNYVVVVMVIHCFNPFTWPLLKIVNTWSECMADVAALEASDNLNLAKSYYDNIVNLFPEDSNTEEDKFFISTLFKNESTLSRRVDFMKRYRKMKAASGVLTTILTAAFVFVSTTSAFASGGAVAKLHDKIYQMTEERLDETPGEAVVADDGMIEYYCDVEDLNLENMQVVSTLDKDIVTFDTGVQYNIDWIVNPNTRHISGIYTLKVGQKIGTSVTVTPLEKDYWLGIMTDDGKARYVQGRGAASHNFVIDENNRYRVFVQNNYTDGVTKLNAKGYFAYE